METFRPAFGRFSEYPLLLPLYLWLSLQPLLQTESELPAEVFSSSAMDFKAEITFINICLHLSYTIWLLAFPNRTSADWAAEYACSGVNSPASAPSSIAARGATVSKQNCCIDTKDSRPPLWCFSAKLLFAWDPTFGSESYAVWDTNLSYLLLRSALVRVVEKATSRKEWVCSDSSTNSPIRRSSSLPGASNEANVPAHYIILIWLWRSLICFFMSSKSLKASV